MVHFHFSGYSQLGDHPVAEPSHLGSVFASPLPICLPQVQTCQKSHPVTTNASWVTYTDPRFALSFQSPQQSSLGLQGCFQTSVPRVTKISLFPLKGTAILLQNHAPIPVRLLSAFYKPHPHCHLCGKLFSFFFTHSNSASLV